MDDFTFTHVMQSWEPAVYDVRQDLIPAGSPDRVCERAVMFNKETGRRYVLEGVARDKQQKRIRQAQTIWELSQAGCDILSPWIPPFASAWGVQYGELFWQVRRYVDGVPLPRETYGQDAWRGEAMGRFLGAMSRASQSLTFAHVPFSLADYVKSLLPRIAEKNKPLFTDLQPIVKELEGYIHAEATLPKTFAHGDFHPLNVIWGEHDLNGVIDWEFLGPKPFGYDAANLLGCLGMDAPENLTGKMALAFVRTLKEQDIAPRDMLYWLPDIIVALRFGWMREWCWRKAKDLIIQELDYMWLVLDNRELLRNRFLNA